MSALLNNIGEEYVAKNGFPTSFTVGLYNDSTDSFTDADDVGDLTSEPSDGSYGRQTGVAGTIANVGGDWQVDNDAQISFDVTGTTGTVDAYFIIVNFQSVEAGDGAPTDHIIITGALSQSRDLSLLDTLNLAANSVGVKLT